MPFVLTGSGSGSVSVVGGPELEFNSISGRDEFFSAAPERLLNGLPILVNIGNDVASIQIWLGPDHPLDYAANDPRWRRAAQSLSNDGVTIGSTNISNAHQSLVIRNPDGRRFMMLGVEYDDSGSSDISYIRLRSAEPLVVNHVATDDISDPLGFIYEFTSNRYVTELLFRPASSGTLRTKVYLGQSAAGELLFDESVVITQEDVDSGEYIAIGRGNDYLLDMGDQVYYEFTGVRLFGSTLAGVPTPSIQLNTQPFIRQQVAISGDVTGSAIVTRLESLTGTDRLEASAVQNLPYADELSDAISSNGTITTTIGRTGSLDDLTSSFQLLAGTDLSLSADTTNNTITYAISGDFVRTSGFTGAAVVALLQALTGTDRLDASAIQNLPDDNDYVDEITDAVSSNGTITTTLGRTGSLNDLTSSFQLLAGTDLSLSADTTNNTITYAISGDFVRTSGFTGPAVVALLQALTGTDRLDASAIQNLPDDNDHVDAITDSVSSNGTITTTLGRTGSLDDLTSSFQLLAGTDLTLTADTDANTITYALSDNFVRDGEHVDEVSTAFDSNGILTTTIGRGTLSDITSNFTLAGGTDVTLVVDTDTNTATFNIDNAFVRTSGFTGAAVVALLQALTGTDRLDASAIQNLPADQNDYVDELSESLNSNGTITTTIGRTGTLADLTSNVQFLAGTDLTLTVDTDANTLTYSLSDDFVRDGEHVDSVSTEVSSTGIITTTLGRGSLDDISDSFTISAGDGITISGDADTDTLTISSQTDFVPSGDHVDGITTSFDSNGILTTTVSRGSLSDISSTFDLIGGNNLTISVDTDANSATFNIDDVFLLGSGFTGSAVVALLQALTGTDRLDASAIQNLPADQNDNDYVDAITDAVSSNGTITTTLGRTGSLDDLTSSFQLLAGTDLTLTADTDANTITYALSDNFVRDGEHVDEVSTAFDSNGILTTTIGRGTLSDITSNFTLAGGADITLVVDTDTNTATVSADATLMRDSEFTGAAVTGLLEALTGADRLEASAIQNLPADQNDYVDELSVTLNDNGTVTNTAGRTGTLADLTSSFQILGGNNISIDVDTDNNTITINDSRTAPVVPNELDLRFGLSQASDPSLVDISGFTDVESPGNPHTVRTGLSVMGDYYYILVSNNATIQRINDTVLGLSVYQDGATDNIFVKTEDAITDGSITFDTYSVGPLNAGVNESYVVHF